MPLRPEQCRGARGLLDWPQEKLAQSAGVSRSTIRDFEGGRHELHRATEAAILGSLERAGVCIIEADEMGPGIRFRACDANPSDAEDDGSGPATD
jgi:predicted transcriptional regulator